MGLTFSLVIRVKPVRLTRHIISTDRFLNTFFGPPEVAKGTSRDTRELLQEYSSTGTDKNFGSAITMDKHLVHIYYTGTLREYSPIAGSRCHRTAYNRSTAQSEIRPAIYPIHVLRRYKIPPTPSIPKRRLPSASHFLLLPSL